MLSRNGAHQFGGRALALPSSWLPRAGWQDMCRRRITNGSLVLSCATKLSNQKMLGDWTVSLELLPFQPQTPLSWLVLSFRASVAVRGDQLTPYLITPDILRGPRRPNAACFVAVDQKPKAPPRQRTRRWANFFLSCTLGASVVCSASHQKSLVILIFQEPESSNGDGTGAC